MNILVIGNGFDLAHQLPTKYSDFLVFIQALQRYKAGTEEKDSKYYHFFFSLSHKKQVVFQEICSLSNNNTWLQHFLQIYEKRLKSGKDGWIDFESEISTIIQAFDSERLRLQHHLPSTQRLTNTSQLINAIYELEFTPENYNKHKARLYDDLNKLIRCLEIYLDQYVVTDNCIPLKDISECNIDHVLSFNYTDTYRKIYDKDSKIQYDFIHGKADLAHSVDSCNMVLGIDEYLIGDKRNCDNEFIQFKKFYQRIYKGTGCLYTDWLKHRRDCNSRMPKLPPMDLHIYFYGHSLDITDADILSKLILEKGAISTFFYHNKAALGNHIANLVKIIGEEELIRRTDGSHRTIHFKQSSPDTV